MTTTLKLALLIGAAVSACQVYGATPIEWNTWNTATSGTIVTGGSPISVGFSVPSSSVDNLVTNYPSYGPSSTFADGSIVLNAPLPANNIIQLEGGNDNINTVTFSAPVLNPVMAIWSLGAGGTPASFVFQNATPVFVAGGPSNEYGGSAITVSGNTVSGQEGNGVVEFLGTYTSINWANPQLEGWYGFNVGIAGPAPVPLPASAWLMLSSLGGIAAFARKRR